MYYPDFLKEKDTIGICAPSAGMGDKLDLFDESLVFLKQNSYQIRLTKSVRNSGSRSAGAKTRAKELNELVCDNNIDMIFCATGGDFMYETLPYINFQNIKDNPKWLAGYSDPTNLLFPVTVNLDIATMYGFNGGSFSLKDNRAQRTNIEYLKGNISKQKSYRKYQSFIDTISGKTKLDKDVSWISKKDLNVTGRCIGGCFEIIENLIGTKWDGVNNFIEKYQDDGIIWYFDVFAKSSYNFYLDLLHMKNCGYFRNCKAVLIGRVAFSNIKDTHLDYIKAADKVLKDIPHICEMDIGHTVPHMTMINGALLNVRYSNGKGSLSFYLK